MGTGSNGNPDAVNEVAVLNDVWDAIKHQLRVGAANSGLSVKKSVTYSAATNANGDFDGTGNPQNLFTVTGQCLIAIVGFCSTAVTGASATLRVGNTTTDTRYIPSQTATNITVGKAVDITGVVSAGTAPNMTPNQIAQDGEVIQGKVGTADITAGVIDYYCFYVPLTAGAGVVAN